MTHNPAVLCFIAAFVLGAMPSWTLLGLLLVAVTEMEETKEAADAKYSSNANRDGGSA